MEDTVKMNEDSFIHIGFTCDKHGAWRDSGIILFTELKLDLNQVFESLGVTFGCP